MPRPMHTDLGDGQPAKGRAWAVRQRDCWAGRVVRAVLASALLLGLAACTGERRWASEACSGEGPCGDGGQCIEGYCAQPCSGNTDCDQGVCLKTHCTSGQYACAHGLCEDGNACSVDLCDPKAGTCKAELLAGPCSDGDVCTVGDECLDAGAGPQCKAAAKCDDGDPGTADFCEPSTGNCSNN